MSVEVVATDYDGMLKQALRIGALADNAVVKIPMTLHLYHQVFQRKVIRTQHPLLLQTTPVMD